MLWVLKNEEKILERKQGKNESVLYEETSLNKEYQDSKNWDVFEGRACWYTLRCDGKAG